MVPNRWRSPNLPAGPCGGCPRRGQKAQSDSYSEPTAASRSVVGRQNGARVYGRMLCGRVVAAGLECYGTVIELTAAVRSPSMRSRMVTTTPYHSQLRRSSSPQSRIRTTLRHDLATVHASDGLEPVLLGTAGRRDPVSQVHKRLARDAALLMIARRGRLPRAS
jgi:hypothetical protein